MKAVLTTVEATLMAQLSMLPRLVSLDDSAVQHLTVDFFVRSHYSVVLCF